ncbi:MAG: rhomboid family intramembrane serine protease [Rhodobacteraceae bacterium]|nr:rhomboid family intramembrane serine protease [Paracoccaceae bacterium]
MFPIRDHNPSGTTPYVTVALIVVNALVFLGTWPFLQDGTALMQFYAQWALVPGRITTGSGYVTILTSMFLHNGWWHLLGNMLFLWVFGDNIEDTFGHVRFLGFYLLCGLAAAAAQILGDPGSMLPMVGASGAIAGVMGGYLLLFPRAKVDFLVIFIVFFRVFVVPAWVVLGLWFGFQLLDSIATDPAAGGVAYSVHVGGFLAGLVLTLPVWLWRGGAGSWRQPLDTPPDPLAGEGLTPTTVPTVRRRR